MNTILPVWKTMLVSCEHLTTIEEGQGQDDVNVGVSNDASPNRGPQLIMR